MGLPARQNDTAVILRLDAIGDFFLWLQSGAADVTAYARGSHRRVVLVANGAWADYARFLGLWDEVIAVDPGRLMRRPVYRLKLLMRVRNVGAAMLIQPRAARVALQEDAIARVSGAAIRIGNAGTAVNRSRFLESFADPVYHRLIRVRTDRDVHELERNDEFVRGLTGAGAHPVDLGARHAVGEQAGLALALGAGQAGRMWPIEKYTAVLRHVIETRPTLPIVMLGAQAQRPLADRLKSQVAGLIQDRVGFTRLDEFVDVIADSKIVVCNDSAAFHVAMALGKKVICILGGGHFGWFAPYPVRHPNAPGARVLCVPMECFWCNWRCRYPRTATGAFKCVDAISVQSAVDSIEALLPR